MAPPAPAISTVVVGAPSPTPSAEATRQISPSPPPAPTRQATPEPAVTPRPLRVGIGEPAFTDSALPLAQREGLFANQGVEVELRRFPSGQQAVEAVGADAPGVDVAFGPIEQVLGLVARGRPIRAIYTHAGRLPYLVVSQRAIRSPEMLRGKQMGIEQPDSNQELLTRSVIAQAGLAPADVRLSATDDPLHALLGFAVDAMVVLPEEGLTIKKLRPEINVLLRLWETQPLQLNGAWVVSERAVRTDSARLERLVAALVRASRLLYQDREKALDVGVRYTGRARDVLAQVYDLHARGRLWSKNDGLTAEAIESTVNRSIGLGVLRSEQKSPLDRWVSRAVVERALGEVGKEAE